MMRTFSVRKITALFLAVAMILALLPAHVSADPVYTDDYGHKVE